MKKKNATAAEKRHMDRVAALGCIACILDGYEDTPACIHHIDRCRDHMRVLPLCPWHHQDGPPGSAIHASRPRFVANYDTEENLLLLVNQQIGVVS